MNGNDRSVLLRFPVEIWRVITPSFGVVEVVRLKLTGDKLLWSRICAPRAVQTITIGELRTPNLGWLSILGELSGLTKFSSYMTQQMLEYCTKQELLFRLPRQLQLLHLPFFRTLDPSILQSSSGSFISFEDIMPNLVALTLSVTCTHRSTWLANLPKTLQKLIVGSFTPDGVVLPAQLLHFGCLDFNSGDTVEDFHFPADLARLSIREIVDFKALLPLIPTALVKLELPRKCQLGPKEFAALPRTIRQLRCGVEGEARSLTSFSWPASLEELKLHDPPFEGWESLPNTLRDLTLEVGARPTIATAQDRVITVLPMSLTTLHLDLNMTLALASMKWPPNLKQLTIPEVHLGEAALASLPTNLVGLSTFAMPSKYFSLLPWNLKKLTTGVLGFNPLHSNQLPRFLTRLTLKVLDVTEPIYHFKCQEWCDLETVLRTSPLEILEASELEQPLTKDRIDEIMKGVVMWPAEARFPLYLDRLDMSSFKSLGDHFYCNIPKTVSFLDLLKDTLVTDLGMMHLPTTLTILDLSAAKKVTGKSFKYFSRSLRFLIVGSEEVYDEDIADLPPPIHYLSLTNAIHLTNACARLLPRGLTDFMVQSNKLFTVHCFEDLPASLKSSNSYRSMVCENFVIRHGQIVPSRKTQE